jgi:hypothetical protein
MVWESATVWRFSGLSTRSSPGCALGRGQHEDQGRVQQTNADHIMIQQCQLSLRRRHGAAFAHLHVLPTT